MADRARARRRACTPTPTGWRPLQVWGMGIASQDLTGDGYPRCSSPARATTSCRRSTTAPAAPTLRGHRARARRHRPPPVRRRRRAAVDRLAPRVRGRQQRRLRRPVRQPRATSRRRPSYATRDPSNLLHRPAGRHVRGRRRGGGHRRLRPGRGRGARRPQPRRAARPRRRQPARARHAVAQRRRRRRRPTGADGQLDRGRARSRPARTSTPSGRGSRCAVGDRTVSARGHRRRRPRRRPARLDPLSGSVTPTGPRSACQWPDGEVGPWMTVGADQFVTIERGAASSRRRCDASRRRASDAMTATVEPASPTSTLPDFGMPGREPLLPASIYADRLERLRARMDARGYDHIVVWARSGAQRQHRLPHRVRPALRGGGADRRAGADREPGDPASATSATASAEAAPLPMRRLRFQDLSLPGQPRDRSRPLPEILADEGIGAGGAGRGRRLEDLREPRDDRGSRRSSSTSCGDATGPAGLVENATDLLIDPADGLRVINEVEQLAAFEWAACQTSHGVRDAVDRPPAGDDRAGGGRAARAGTARRCRAT